MSRKSVCTTGPASLYGRLLRPVARFAFKQLVGADGLSPQVVRKRVDVLGLFSKRLSGIERISTKVGTLDAQWLISDEATPESPVILYLHGGGYVAGSIKSHWELAARLARAARARCLILEYRLAPEHPFPAALEDSIAAWQWLLRQGVQAEQIVLAGDSAGGGLSLATSLKLRELGQAQPAGIYCMSPWTDVSLSGDSVQSKRRQEVVLVNPSTMTNAAHDYAGEHNRQDPFISPLFADLQGLPPTLLHTGTEETLLDDSTRLQERAAAAGVDCQLKIWEGMWHVWPLFAPLGLPEARQSIHEAGQFINAVVGGARATVSDQQAA